MQSVVCKNRSLNIKIRKEIIIDFRRHNADFRPLENGGGGEGAEFYISGVNISAKKKKKWMESFYCCIVESIFDKLHNCVIWKLFSGWQSKSPAADKNCSGNDWSPPATSGGHLPVQCLNHCYTSLSSFIQSATPWKKSLMTCRARLRNMFYPTAIIALHSVNVRYVYAFFVFLKESRHNSVACSTCNDNKGILILIMVYVSLLALGLKLL